METNTTGTSIPLYLRFSLEYGIITSDSGFRRNMEYKGFGNSVEVCVSSNWGPRAEQTRTAMAMSGGKKNISFKSLYFIKHKMFTLVTLYVFVFVEITLTSGSPSERNDGR